MYGFFRVSFVKSTLTKHREVIVRLNSSCILVNQYLSSEVTKIRIKGYFPKKISC